MPRANRHFLPGYDRGSEAIAVGSLTFVDKMKSELGFKARYREVATYTLWERGKLAPVILAAKVTR